MNPTLQAAVRRTQIVFKGAELGSALGRASFGRQPGEENELHRLDPGEWSASDFRMFKTSTETDALDENQVKSLLPAAFHWLALGEDLTFIDSSLWFLAPHCWRDWPAEEAEAVLGFCDAWLDVSLEWQTDDPSFDLDQVLVTLASLGIDTVIRMREEVKSGDPRRVAFLVALCGTLRNNRMCKYTWSEQKVAARSIDAFIYGADVEEALECVLHRNGDENEQTKVFRELRAYLRNRISSPFDRHDTYDWS